MVYSAFAGASEVPCTSMTAPLAPRRFPRHEPNAATRASGCRDTGRLCHNQSHDLRDKSSGTGKQDCPAEPLSSALVLTIRLQVLLLPPWLDGL